MVPMLLTGMSRMKVIVMKTMTPTSTEITWLQGGFQDLELSSVFTLMLPELASVQLIRVRGETVQVVESPKENDVAKARTWCKETSSCPN